MLNKQMVQTENSEGTNWCRQKMVKKPNGTTDRLCSINQMVQTGNSEGTNWCRQKMVKKPNSTERKL